MKIVIFGSGSVGVHYSKAWSKLTTEISLVDTSPDALQRTKNNTWLERYGESFPSYIKLVELSNFDWSEHFNIAVIGTPPSSHSTLLEQLLSYKMVDVICVQKPIATPIVTDIQKHLSLEVTAQHANINLVSGYNHRYSQAFSSLLQEIAKEQSTDKFQISVEWNESWDGIMKAHPWLGSPKETYLGSTKPGGGAAFEHSHGLDLGLFLWQNLTNEFFSELGASFVVPKDGTFDQSFKFEGHSNFKQKSLFVNQDVFTTIPSKRITISVGDLEATLNFNRDKDTLHIIRKNIEETIEYKKTRETDFDAEVNLVEEAWKNPKLFQQAETLSFGRALNTSILGSICVQKFWDKSEAADLENILKTRFGSQVIG